MHDGSSRAERLAALAAAAAPRLAKQIKAHGTILLRAPARYAPAEMASAAMAHLYGEDGFRSIRLGLGADLRGPLPLLVLARNTGGDVPTDALNSLLGAFYADGVPQVLVVVESEDLQPLEHPFEVMLDFQSLVATASEVMRVYPALRRPHAAMRRVMALTGGVPSIVAAADPDQPDRGAVVCEAARPAALQLLQQAETDPLLELHLSVGRMPADDMAVLATEFLGKTVTANDIRKVRVGHHFTQISKEGPLLPEAVAAEGRELMAERDAVLATKMHLLAAVPRQVRGSIIVHWPKEIPPRLTYLAHARRFVDGGVIPSQLSLGIPAMLRELVSLMLGEADPPAGGRRRRNDGALRVPVPLRRREDHRGSRQYPRLP